LNIYLRTATETSYAQKILANGAFTLHHHNPLPTEVADELTTMLTDVHY